MKKLLAVLFSAILCVALAFGVVGCGKDDTGTTNPDGTPKNMVETLIELDNSVQGLKVSEYSGGSMYGPAPDAIPIRKIYNNTLEFKNYYLLTMHCKEIVKDYRITKVSIKVTTETELTLHCHFFYYDTEGVAQTVEYPEINLSKNESKTIVFENLNLTYINTDLPAYKRNIGMGLFNEEDSKNPEIMNLRFKFSDLYIEAEKI